jgi:hypothetical protein
MAPSSRRDFLLSLAGGCGAAVIAPRLVGAEAGRAVETVTIAEGDLKAVLRDNSQSPKTLLSGVDSLFNVRESPGFDAYDPDSRGASAGLNFEHIICGHANPNNAFAPRKGRYDLVPGADGKSATLIRRREDDPWSMSSMLKYTVTAPHFIDVDFRCVPHDRVVFGARGYAIFFFANYMNDVENVALHFRGVEGPNQPEKWITADAPPGPADWNSGGTYRSASATDLEYDADHNFKLNLWSYDSPRFTQPFYYGRAAKGMVLIQMFDRTHTDEEEIRFSLFKFKVPRFPRPAWDFQYVIRRIEEGKEYGFKARLVWKKFVSADDCLSEYQSWKSRQR